MPLTRPALRTALALLAACCAAFAPAPVYREPKPDRRTDQEKLQGTWEVVNYSLNGDFFNTIPGESADVFDVPHVSFIAGGKVVQRRSVSLDPTATPKRMDQHTNRGEVVRGIYRLQGDRLTLAFSLDAGVARPTDFKGGPGILVKDYRRVKRGK